MSLSNPCEEKFRSAVKSLFLYARKCKSKYRSCRTQLGRHRGHTDLFFYLFNAAGALVGAGKAGVGGVRGSPTTNDNSDTVRLHDERVSTRLDDTGSLQRLPGTRQAPQSLPRSYDSSRTLFRQLHNRKLFKCRYSNAQPTNKKAENVGLNEVNNTCKLQVASKAIGDATARRHRWTDNPKT